MIAAVLILLNSCFFLPREEEVLAPPLVEPPEISYQTHTVSVGTIEDSIRAFGAFAYAGQADLSFERRGGRLKTLYVRVGADVEKGRLIADLHTDNIEAEIAQAELSLRRAELAYQARAGTIRHGVLPGVRQGRSAVGRVAPGGGRGGLAAGGGAGFEVTGGGAALSGLRRRVAEAEISVQKGVLTVRRLEEADTPLGLELARIDVDAAELRLDQLDAELEATRLYAPISGKVT